MSDFVRWLLLALTAGRLVPVASTAMRRSLSCVEQLQVVGIICPAFCEVTLSAASCVCHAVHDIDDKISKSAKEAIEEATEILRSSIKLLKKKLPIHLLATGRKKRSLEKPKRAVQGLLSGFHFLAMRAASATVQAVKDGSKKIRDTMFNTIITLFLKHDNASETARYILGKVISKRSINESVVIDALCKISVEMKASMMKAVMTAIRGFKIMLNNMVVKMKTLLQSKVFVGFFDTSKAQIADLANRAGKHLVDVHHGLAMKSVTGAIMKVNDLMITVCIVEKAIKNFDALFKSLRNVVEAASKGVKDAIHSVEANPQEDVTRAMKNAADQMMLDYNELVWIVMIYGAKPGK